MLVSGIKRTIPSSCCCNLKWNGYHPPPLPFPSPLPLPTPQPQPRPHPKPHHSIPSTRPPDRSSSRERSSQIPNDNALFQHVCFATNHGGLTLIESTIILFAKHLYLVHTTHTPCCHHFTAMLGPAVLGNPTPPHHTHTTTTAHPPTAIVHPIPEPSQSTNGR